MNVRLSPRPPRGMVRTLRNVSGMSVRLQGPSAKGILLAVEHQSVFRLGA